MTNKAFGMPAPGEGGVVPGESESQRFAVVNTARESGGAVGEQGLNTAADVQDVLSRSTGLVAPPDSYRDADRNVC